MGADVDIVSIWENVTGVLPVSFQAPPPPTGGSAVSDFIVNNVIKTSTQNKDYIIPNGKTLTIQTASGIMAETDTGSQDVFSRFIWDPVTVNETFEIGRTVFNVPVIRGFVGNGVKVIRISIQNNSNSDLWLSSRWVGYLTDT